MVLKDKVIFLSHLILAFFDFFKKELDDLTARGADQVIMMMIGLWLERNNPSIEITTNRQPTFLKKVKCAINRGDPNLGIELARPSQKLFDGNVILGLEKFLGNGFPSRRVSQTLLLNIGIELL